MKRKSIFTAALLMSSLIFGTSCQKTEEKTGEDTIHLCFSAVIEPIEATKTTLGGDPSDPLRQTLWLPADSILVSNGTVSSKFINTAATASATAQFEGKLPSGSKMFFAFYPYSSSTTFASSSFETVLPGTQTYYPDGISSDCAPMVAKTNDSMLNFQNLCGILVLQLTGTNSVSSITFSGEDEGGNPIPVSGRGTVSMDYSEVPSLVMDHSAGTSVTLNCPQPVVLNPSTPTTFHMILPPATFRTFSLTITDSNGGTMFLKGTKSLVIGRSQRVVAKSVDFIPGEAADLSAKGTANCYVVSKVGKYKFKATMKGGSTESVGTPSYAEILWETFGTNVTPTKGDVVQNALYSDGYVTFNTRSALNNGNAVIAVKDASGTILWSWHIWVCSGFDPKTTAQNYNHYAGTMMDRNLGATSTTPGDVHALGLLYQWGRKDPFPGSSSKSSGSKAKSTGNWPSTIASTSSTGKLSYVEKNPMQFITANASNYDWYYTGSSSTDNTRWQTSGKAKGLYDPCPSGWRVPDGGPTDSLGVWSTAFGRSTYWTNTSNWDGINKGMDFGKTDSTLIKRGSGQCWYPAAGYLDCADASLDDVGSDGGYWSCTPVDYYAYFLYVLSNGIVSPASSYYAYRSYAQSVRCVLESPAPASGSTESYGKKDYDW